MSQKNRREHGSGQITKRGDGKYLLRYRIPGTGKRVSKTVEAKNDKAASSTMRDWIAEVTHNGHRDSTLRMNQLFDLFESDLKRNQRASYGNVKLKLDRYLRPRLGDREARSVKKSDLEAYKDRRKAEGASNGTVNHELSYIVRAFRLGIDDDLLATYPKVKKLDERGGIRLGFIEHEAYLTVLTKLPEHQRFLFACGYHWGMRRGELLKLRREWVRLHEAKPIVKIPGTATKNGRPRTLPIYGDLKGWFDMAQAEWVQSPDCPWLFTYQGRRLKDPRTGFHEAAADAGFPNLLFHDLRRTAVRNMERAGVPRSEAMQISGHTTESTYKRYDIASERGAIKAGDTMENFFTALGTTGSSGKVGHKLGTSNEHLTFSGVV